MKQTEMRRKEKKRVIDFLIHRGAKKGKALFLKKRGEGGTV